MLLGFNERKKEVFNVCCQYIINNGPFNFEHVRSQDISKTLLGSSENLNPSLYVHIWEPHIKTGFMPHTTTIVGGQVNTSSVFAASWDKNACNLYNVKGVCVCVFRCFFYFKMTCED